VIWAKFALTPFLLLSIQVHARIVDFHSDIRVAKSGELTVTERITVEVSAKEKPAALVRELQGPFRVVDVIRNGHPEPWTLDGARVRIGREAPAPGRHLYQIAYRSSRRIEFLDGGYDELRWRLAAAERITAEVALPAAVPARDIRARALGGEVQSFVRDGRAAFRTKEPVTIVVRFPKEVVAAPGLGRRARWFFEDYQGLLAVLAGLGATAAVLYRIRILSARA
jgi:hypothetical protein